MTQPVNASEGGETDVASPTRTAEFSLIDEPWIPVMDLEGRKQEASLLELYTRAGTLHSIACELPSQSFAILRLALAVLHRATGGPTGESGWRTLWKTSDLPVADLTDYLDAFRDRFDLFHPIHPFYQVADLRSAKDGEFGLERLIADVPNGVPFLTARAGSGMVSMSAADAARWIVHCQAFDPSGIKTGAVGDPRVTGGKGYPMGVGSAGSLGGVNLEGSTLRETLLLNLLPVTPNWHRADERDLPVWERPPQTAAEEADATRGPFGPVGLFTWQSRRIRLFGDRNGVTGAMIANGDKLDWQDRHLTEPMSVWGRSGPREKDQKRAPIYLPRPHDDSRQLWRGLQTLLPPPTPGGEHSQRLAPLVSQWLAHLEVAGVIGKDFAVRQRATSIRYGTQQAVVDEVYGDSLTMNVLVLVDGSALRTAAVDAAADAEKAVTVLRTFATNLARAAGSRDTATGAADRAGECGYAVLDRGFRRWLADLGPDSDLIAEREAWQRLVRQGVRLIARELADGAGPAAWAGRMIEDRAGRQVHLCTSQAQAWFDAALAKALPMAQENTDQ